MNENKYQSRLKEFRKEIRRTQIENIKKERRMAATLGESTISQVAALMKVDLTAEMTIKDIVSERSRELISPPLHPDKIQAETDIPIESHIHFWKYLSEQFFMNENLHLPEIVPIFEQILNSYTYQEIHHNVVF